MNRPFKCVRCMGTHDHEMGCRAVPDPVMTATEVQARTVAAMGRRSHLPTDSAARKAAPMARGLLDYFPDALAEVARLSAASNEKHNPGEPLHWSREKSSDHADCIMRHLADRGTMDDDGFLHDVKVAWRALAQLQLALEAQTVISPKNT